MDQPTSTPSVDQRWLVFQVGDQRHEIDAGRVLEVVRAPHLTRVPNGPEALAGIANVRGRPIPVLSMARILGEKAASPSRDGKIILYEHGDTVGLLVDNVLELSIDVSSSLLQGLSERLDAAFKVAKRAPAECERQASRDLAEQELVKLVPLLSFRVAGQLYGIPLDQVIEVARLATDVAKIPNAETGFVGLVSMRDGTLPLFSLAALLGLETADAGSHIVIVEYEGDLIGLVVDEMDVIRRLSRQVIDAVPNVLQRGRGDAQIEAIGRVADSGLLISILSADKLLARKAVTQTIGKTTGAKPMTPSATEQKNQIEKFLIFQLGEENYGLPIASVEQVIRIPSDITRVPGAPVYVLGVVNLRGKAIPLIDQRKRFDTAGTAQLEKARAIIVTLGSLQAGFVVDGVSDVKVVSSSAVLQAPDFSTEQTDVFDRIAHIETDGRMILVVNPKELLSRAEQDIVAAVALNKNVVTDP